MRCLLPPNHFVNRKSVHYSANTIMYICSYILPIPFIYLSIHYQDANEVKHYYEMTYSMTFPDLYSPQVVAIMPSNPWAIVCGIGVFLACFLQALIIFGCTYFSYQSLKKVSSSLSITTKKHHINLLKSLTVMIVALGMVVIVVIPLLASLFIFNSARTGNRQETNKEWLFTFRYSVFSNNIGNSCHSNSRNCLYRQLHAISSILYEGNTLCIQY